MSSPPNGTRIQPRRRAASVTRRFARVLALLASALVVLSAIVLVVASLIYPVEYVRRIALWGESDVVPNVPSRPACELPQP